MKFLSSIVIFSLSVFIVNADDEKKNPLPEINDRPVYKVPGKIAILPKGMEVSAKGYKGQMGIRPFTVITIDGKIVGEIYIRPLKGSPKEEADGMKASADKEEILTSVERSEFKDGERVVEVARMRIDAESKFGKPWVIHSLYYPLKESSVTFKLACSEADFDKLLPYLRAMLSLDEEERKEVTK